MNNNQTKTGTNIQKVRQQNAGQGQFGTEFASETNAQEVEPKINNLLLEVLKAHLLV